MQKTSPEIFAATMLDFIKSSEKLVLTLDNPYSKLSFGKLCGFLGIARLEFVHNIPNRANRLFLRDLHYILFSLDSYDESRPFTIVKQHEDGCVSNYSFFPLKDVEWDDEDRSRIATFVSALYVINDRVRIASVAEKFSVMDNEMDLYNLRYFMKRAGEMFASGELREYCACRFNIIKLSVINAKLGRDGGTEIMKRYVYKLRDIVGEDGFISRLGGDNFVSLFK